MNAKPRVVLTRNQKLGWFIVGFLGWFLVHGALGAVIYVLGSINNNVTQGLAAILSGLLLLANPAALIALAFIPRGQWAALGALAAITVVFCIVLLLGASLAAICFSSLNSGNL
jgi:hypothetical protein